MNIPTRTRHPRPVLDELRDVPLFGGCTDKELSRIDGLGVRVQVDAGAVLCRQGRIGKETFVVIDGEAVVTIGGVEVDRLGPGAFFGEMSLLDGAPRAAAVTAVTPIKLLVFNPLELGRLLEDAGIARQMLSTVSLRLRRADAVFAGPRPVS